MLGLEDDDGDGRVVMMERRADGGDNGDTV